MSVTLAILVITGLISYQGFNNYNVVERLKHHPYSEHKSKEYYRLISSGFVHGGWLHLIINMYVLFEFGSLIEKQFSSIFGMITGPIVFLVFYLSAIIVGDLPTHFQHKNNSTYAAVGASGAVSAIVFVFIMFYPFATLALYGLIPFKAIVGGIAYLIYSSWAAKNRNDGIGHTAHLFGALYGIVFIAVAYPPVLSSFVSQFQNLF